MKAPGRRSVRPGVALSLQAGEDSPPCPVSRARLRRWIEAALEGDARITLRFVGIREARALNRAYRGIDHATNVLTFAYGEQPGVGGGAGSGAADSRPLAADIAICLPVVEREARQQGKPLAHHLAHMVIHGVLHARGFEHDEDAQARAMEALETALLRRFRIPDPYAPTLGPRRRVRLS